jgi:hypothetical protein
MAPIIKLSRNLLKRHQKGKKDNYDESFAHNHSTVFNNGIVKLRKFTGFIAIQMSIKNNFYKRPGI